MGPCSGDGVTITASDVTFDLGRAHAPRPVEPARHADAPQTGITVTTGATNVQVGNGTVTGFVDGIGVRRLGLAGRSRWHVAGNCVNGWSSPTRRTSPSTANTVTGNGSDGLLLLDADASLRAGERRVGESADMASCSSRVPTATRSATTVLKGNGGGRGWWPACGGTDTRIVRNLAQGNLQGIALHTSDNVVEGNIASANQTVGITVAQDGAGHNRLDGNTATGNGAIRPDRRQRAVRHERLAGRHLR